ncbi:hypothetical protein [Parendozoicomonas sp. Alg238-R29]|uniref:hypothetical protein n=1 Tax=Parendozoicomonas sp. Alg238-R29 TaxID=2993446 RepID=UPI00248E9885|nr:hypothetical protein [Parendozoicomonas sp. Alg238-R29]
MTTGIINLRKAALALITALALGISPVFAAKGPTQAQAENPSFFAMTGDLLIARPLMLATTVIGGAVFVVSSPFSAAGGNLLGAANTLVKKPFDATFRRCLGCSFPSEESL